MNRIKAASLSLFVVLATLFSVAGASAATAAPVAPALTAAQGNNIIGKPIPALDYAHAPKGKSAPKGKFVPITTKKMTARTACTLCYFYGGGKQTVSTDTSSISFSVEQPSCTTYCFHSLAENAVQTLNGQQVVEWGWTVDTQGVNGTDHVKPHLFAFRWVNGVGGTYNGSGWVNAVGSTCPAGMDVSADVSVASANVYGFGIQHINGGWWTAYKGNWCGAYPDSVWTGATPAATFTQADQVQIFGEVAASDTTPTNVAMGSGVVGAASPSAGARASSFGLGTTTVTTPALTMFNDPAAPTHYNAVLTPPSLRTFRYGGKW